MRTPAPLLTLLLAIAYDAHAWGGKGHRLVAGLAEKRLRAEHPNALNKISALLGPGATLASIATCPDSIRDYVANKDKPDAPIFPNGCLITKEQAVAMFPSTTSWHFINIPLPASANSSEHPAHVLQQACQANAPCITTQIDHFTAQLKNKTLDTKTRAIALMFLVHLVGDIHQPLHAVSRRNDKGGNDVWVRLGDHVGKLHSVWDSLLLDKVNESDVHGTVIASNVTPESWAWESYDTARRAAYRRVPIRPSTQTNPIALRQPVYTITAMPVVKERLHSASVRLANVLAGALAD